METMDLDSRNPARQPSAPRVHWEKKVFNFPVYENDWFIATADNYTPKYWIVGTYWYGIVDGKIHVEITAFRATGIDEQPEGLRELIEEYLTNDYQENIIFD